MGIDFMVLTNSTEEEVDTEGEEKNALTEEQVAQRRFSKQAECLEIVPKLAHLRRASFLRQRSKVSFKSQCSFMESSCAIADDVVETVATVVFVSICCKL